MITSHKTQICINTTVRASNLVVIIVTSHLLSDIFHKFCCPACLSFTSYGSGISCTNRCQNHISHSATLLIDKDWHASHHVPDMTKQDKTYNI